MKRRPWFHPGCCLRVACLAARLIVTKVPCLVALCHSHWRKLSIEQCRLRATSLPSCLLIVFSVRCFCSAGEQRSVQSLIVTLIAAPTRDFRRTRDLAGGASSNASCSCHAGCPSATATPATLSPLRPSSCRLPALFQPICSRAKMLVQSARCALSCLPRFEIRFLSICTNPFLKAVGSPGSGSSAASRHANKTDKVGRVFEKSHECVTAHLWLPFSDPLSSAVLSNVPRSRIQTSAHLPALILALALLRPLASVRLRLLTVALAVLASALKRKLTETWA